MNKICTKCKQSKDLSCFYNKKDGKNGVDSICKQCRCSYASSRKVENIIAFKKWRTLHSEQHKIIQINSRKNNPIRVWCNSTLYHHKKEGFNICITQEELKHIAKETLVCNICGCVLNWTPYTSNGKTQQNSPSLDRINNDTIITKENIQIICHQCNRTKGERTMEEFINYCKMVVNKY